MPTQMDQRILEIETVNWTVPTSETAFIDALEAGKILFFPKLSFETTATEGQFFNPAMCDPKSRNISLNASDRLKGAVGDETTQSALASMIRRFRTQSQSLIQSIAPQYVDALRLGATSFRPMEVVTRRQSWRADDRRLHVDSFPSRPNCGERILRVFTNLNPSGEPRVWRIGEPFEAVARRFLPRAKSYSAWQATVLNALHVTKSFRSEYDHLMLQLHDAIKSDSHYQSNAPQVTMPFPAGCVWVCFSDQASHAVMSGQYMMEQTFHLPVDQQYDRTSSPLAILTRLTGRALV